tara:strand:- start:340 stop:591 length:252 start_codon:yes stop_codon:yes gene_type:complete
MKDQSKLDLIKRNIKREAMHSIYRTTRYTYVSMRDGSITHCNNFVQWRRIAELDRAKYEAADPATVKPWGFIKRLVSKLMGKL